MAEIVSEKSGGLTFAERQMLRHGWQPGKGLGRHEDGMSEPIKVKVKSDKGGVGHKLGDQFTFKWWDHVFNKASSNLSVESCQDGIVVKKVNDEEEEGMISNKRPLKASLSRKSMEYGCFVKSATLMFGEEPPGQRASSSDDSSDSEDDDQKLDLSSATHLSDAELLKVCGGRTAHKGARHGLTMSAKLARLEQQEQEFMAKYSKKATSVAPHTEASAVPSPKGPSNEEGVPQKTKGKKEKQKSREAEDLQDSVANGEADGPEISPDGSKQKKKKKRSSKEPGDADADAAEAPEEGSAEDQNTEDTKSKKKKKKKKQRSSNQETEESNKNGCQEDFKDAITMSTEEPRVKHTVDTDVELQRALKKKKKKQSKKDLLVVENADNSVVVNGHHTDATYECEDSSDVLAEGKEQCTIDQQMCMDLDSKKKKKKNKCSKSKEDISSLSEDVMQNGETGEEISDVTGAEERTNRKRKAKKRKASSDDESGSPDGDSTTVKKRKKGKRKAERTDL